MMTLKVKRYDNPHHFWDEVAPELKKEETKNSLLLGLSHSFQTNPTGCLYQAAVFDNRNLLGALVCSSYGSVQNLIPSPHPELHSIERLWEDFQSTQILAIGIVGEAHTCEAYEKFFQTSGKTTTILMNQGIYRCRKVTRPKPIDGFHLRVAEPADKETVARWIQDFQMEAIPSDPPLNAKKTAEDKISKGMVFVGEIQNTLISMAAWTRDIGTSCSIHLVFTPKHLREKGYASAVVSHLTDRLLQSGKRETNLYTDLDNPTSNAIYQKIGYQFICDSVYKKIEDR